MLHTMHKYLKTMIFVAVILIAGIVARTVQVGLGGNGGSFFEHAFCIQYYKPLLIWLVSNDGITFLCYLAIPAVIYRFRMRDDIPRPLAWCSICFILFCGLGHLTDAITYFSPIYWTRAVIGSLTAIASVATVAMLHKYRDWFKSAPTRASLEHAIGSIQEKIDEEPEDERLTEVFEFLLELKQSKAMTEGTGEQV